MKAVVYDAPGSFTITEVPTPDPKPGEVRVQVRQTGICGTDLHIHNGKFFAEFPFTPGHELIGPVDALGDGTEGFRVGEYVSVNPNMNCGHCEYCRTGRTLMCANLKGLGTNWPGSFAEYVSVPANLVFSVDGIDPEGLITYRFALDDYADALDALRGDRTVHKIIIECRPQ
jgi:D-arabinitol dehydrogenase (NADP+)